MNVYTHSRVVSSTGHVGFVIFYDTGFSAALANIAYLVYSITLYVLLFRVTLGNLCYHTFHVQGFVMNILL